MKHKINSEWLGNMTFEATVNGHKIKMDAVPEVGGENAGPRPKELMLASLAGCTGMDVVSILKKMRVNLGYFNVIVEGEVTEEHPKHYIKMNLIYQFKGQYLSMDSLKKAIELSQEKYCGVSAVYKQTMEITYQIEILK